MIKVLHEMFGTSGNSRLEGIIDKNHQDMLLLPGFDEKMSRDDQIRFEKGIYENSENEKLKKEWYDLNHTYKFVKPLLGGYLVSIAITTFFNQISDNPNSFLFSGITMATLVYGCMSCGLIENTRRYKRIFNEDSQEVNQTAQTPQEEYSN